MKLVSIKAGISLAVLAIVGWAGHAAAEVAQFQAFKDNTLYESSTGALSNGIGESLFAGNTATGLTRRAVLAFDVAAQIPPGSVINSASLMLTVTRTIDPATPEVSVHALLADWGEGNSHAAGNEGGGAPATDGDATWVHTFWPAELWASQGGDFDPTASASLPVGGLGTYGWSSAALAADVQGWVDNPGTNFGWILIGEEIGSTTARQFASRENPNEGSRPVLVVDYTPAAGGTLALTASANQTSFSTGGTVDLTIGARNPGLSGTVDVYVVILLPDGDTLVNFTGLDGALELGSLTDVAALTPMVPALSLAAAFDVTLSPFFTYSWSGAEPPGTYAAFLVMAEAGSFADGSVDPGDLVQLDGAAFTFNP
jgi:hypothetical protein